MYFFNTLDNIAKTNDLMTIVPEVAGKLTSMKCANLAQILVKTNYFALLKYRIKGQVLFEINIPGIARCYSYTFLWALIIFCQGKSLAPKLTKSGLSKLSRLL